MLKVLIYIIYHPKGVWVHIKHEAFAKVPHCTNKSCIPEMCFQRLYAKYQLQRHTTEYARSAQCEFLQPFPFAIDQSWSISAKWEQNCIAQILRNKKCSLFRKGWEEQKLRWTSVRIRNERESRKMWSLQRKKCQQRGTTDTDTKQSFCGALRKNPNRRFISVPVMNCPAGESAMLCGEGVAVVQAPSISVTTLTVLASPAQSVTCVGPGKQPHHKQLSVSMCHCPGLTEPASSAWC